MIVLSERAYKVLRIILFFGIVLGAAVAIYLLFFRSSSPLALLPTTSTSTQPGGTLPTAGRANLAQDEEPVGAPLTGSPSSPTRSTQTTEVPRTTVLVDTAVRFPSASVQNTGEMRFYNPADGKFYRVNADGTITVLSDKAFYDVSNVNWGKQSDKAILEFPDGSNVYFNFAEGRQATLPKHWEDFTFSPNDGQIVAKSMGNNESNRYLVISNPDGSDAQPIQELGNNGDKVFTAWSPTNQVVAYSHTGDPLGLNREQIVLIGKNQENLPGLITEGRGFTPSWSPTGNRLLYSVYTSTNGYLPELWISGGTTETINSGRRRLELNTWADKCSWQSDEVLYCAVPETLETGAALQREALEQGPDQLVRINTRTGAKSNLGRIEGVSNVRALQISQDGETAFIQDRSSGNLIRMALTTP